MVGNKVEYVKNKGLNDDTCQKLIINALQKMGSATKQELLNVINAALPAILSPQQKEKKTSNLLQKMKKDGIIDTDGGRRFADRKSVV